MTTPIDAVTAMLPLQVPEDPTPGQVIDIPKGRYAGGTTVLLVYRKTKLIGTSPRLLPIQNVARKYILERAALSVPIGRNDIIRVQARQLSFTQITFVEYIGWVGTKTHETELTLSDKFYRVLTAVPVGPQGEHVFLYEKVCLNIIEPKRSTKK
jgi:hypothetical protein